VAFTLWGSKKVLSLDGKVILRRQSLSHSQKCSKFLRIARSRKLVLL